MAAQYFIGPLVKLLNGILIFLIKTKPKKIDKNSYKTHKKNQAQK
jgi:hypothetical protein